MFNGKIDKFEEIDNEIDTLKTSKLELKHEIDKIDIQITNKEEARMNYGIQYFLNREKRENLLNEALKYGYSEVKIKQLQPFVDNWNQDIVTKDILDSFRTIEKFVNNNHEPYKENIMYKFSKIFHNEGGNINEN
ncbi:MAG: hypothetical protein PHD56_08680 [Anaerostipes sp.]|nr:hypothetical protein [Anaerostipes sp.]